MSHPVRVSLRAPPHLPFIQGFPGIPGGPSRRPPGIHGTVEVRIGTAPIKAKWVRVEIRKHETIPPGFKTSSSEDRTTWEHVGEIQTLWHPLTPGKEFDVLETADFKFFLPLPENIPPTVTMMKDSGIRYELVAAVCYKQKGGMFKKDAASVNKATEDLRITKHELNSAWPLYNQPDSFSATSQKGQISLTVQRPWSAFGPNDRILLTAVLKSNEAKPFRVKGFECTLLEVVTVTQPTSAQDKRKSKKVAPPATKSRTVASARYPIDETIGRGGEKSARIDIPMASDKLLTTVRNGRSIEVGYELEVKAVCDGIPEVAVKGIKYVVGPFSRSHSQQAVRDIGHFPPLCPGPPGPHSSNPPSTRPDSPTNTIPRTSPPMQSPSRFAPNNPASRELGQPDFPPGFSGHPLSRPPVQGFEPRLEDNRRKSSSTITTTTTTHEFGVPASMAMSMSGPGSRSYSTMPSGRNSMPVPTPYQNGHLLRTPSYGSSVDRPLSPQLESPGSRTPQDTGDGPDWRNKRYSAMTTGTFGMRDRDPLESLAENEYSNSSVPSSSGARTPRRPSGSPARDSFRTPPSAWLPAEQEKQRLYNEARARAANVQSQTGASMQDIGMDAPPDYDTPSRHTQLSSGGSSPVIPALVLTAAEEKEEQRKRYEAATGGGSGSSITPPALGIGRQPTYLSAAEEKEVQKKRYNDAISRGGPAPESPSRSASPSTGGMPWATLTAAEEKELQRKRYEEATSRVGGSDIGHGSMSSRAISPYPNGSPVPKEDPVPYDAIYPGKPAENSPRNAGPTALSDNEAMNRYVYAKDKRASRVVSNPSSSPTPSSPLAPASSQSSRRPVSMQAGPNTTSALSGNEAMRRYHDNQARGDRSVAQPVLKGQEAPPPFPSNSTGAIDEKAQMKRYYEALDKVNTAQSGGGGSSSGPSYADIPPPIEPPVLTPASKPATYMSAAEEKDQMRKRFEEAQARVGQAQGAGPRMEEPAQASGSSRAQQSSSQSQYMSAEEEKEQMRKRYEAATAAVGGSPSIPNGNIMPQSGSLRNTSGPTMPTQYLSAVEEKEQMKKRFEQATAAVNKQSTQSPTQSPTRSQINGGSSKPSYLSAAEEKEQMRKRFEDATAAVNRSSRDPPPSIDKGGSSSSGVPAQPKSTPYLSAAEEKEQMRKRFESAQAAFDRNTPTPAARSPPVQPQPTRTLSTPKVVDPNAPPPPLPTRPPVEYITLLSPVHESERPPWSKTFGSAGQGSGEGSGR